MNTRRALLFLSTTFLIGPVLAPRTEAQEAMPAMRKFAAEFDHAMSTKNISWFEQVAAPTYYEIDEHGHRSERAKTMADMKQNFAMMDTKKCVSTVLSAKKVSNGIDASLRTVMEAKLKGPNAAAKGVLKGEIDYTQHWVKLGGQWKLASMRSTKQVFTLNGKPMPGM